jgi:hypothetical protein
MRVVLREKAEAKNIIKFSPGRIIDNLYFEQGRNGIYLVYNLVEKVFEVSKNPEKVWGSITFENVTYRPLSDLLWKPVFLPKPYIEQELWKGIRDFIYAHIDFTCNTDYDVATAFVLHSWRLEHFKTTPYLSFYGPPASGKTWSMEVLAAICYRGFLVTNITPATLFRIAQEYQPTLFLDEIQTYNQKDKSDIISLLNNGYRRGQVVPRLKVNKLTGEEQMVFYRPFCAKGFAGTEETTKTLATRALRFVMTRPSRPVKMEIDEEEAEKLRSQLFQYRLACLSNSISPVPVNVPEEYKTYGRNIEIVYPLITVAPENLKPQFYQLAGSLETQRMEEEASSLEASVFRALIAVHQLAGNEVFLPLAAIADHVNLHTESKMPLEPRTIAKVVEKLGFKRRRYKSLTHFEWNEAVYQRQLRRYGAGD